MALRRTVTKRNFDSSFEPAQPGQAAKLTIELKVSLVPLDPTAGTPEEDEEMTAHIAHRPGEIKHGRLQGAGDSDPPAKCQSWMANEWAEFKTKFKYMAELGWNEQMIFLPGDGLSDRELRMLIGNPRIQAHAKGALAIKLMPDNGPGHAKIGVARVEQHGGKFRQQMHLISHRAVEFRRHTDDRWPDAYFGQSAVAHEVGHWLHELSESYFRHIDADYADTLPEDEQDRQQYGHTLGLRQALMGAGNVVTQHEATPWLNRIKLHLPVPGGWTMMHRIHFGHVMADVSARQKRATGRPVGA